MPDLWFFAGLALGVAVSGFCAVGSFERGADMARRKALSFELSARQRAVVATRKPHSTAVMSRKTRDLLAAQEERSRRAVIDSRVATVERPQEQRQLRRAEVG